MAVQSAFIRRNIAAPIAVLITLLMSLTLVTPVNASVATAQAASKPQYKFTVEIAMAAATAERNGGYAAAIAKYSYQWRNINAQFNGGGGLNATYLFSGVEGHEYFDNATDELARPHPTTNLKVIYDEDANMDGGWNRIQQTIVHKWPADRGGSFAAWATDGLVHELGHYRGATDEYACNVEDPAKNPVNGTTFRAPVSIMGTTYDGRNWSAHASGLINMQGRRTDEPSPSLASEALPPLQVLALDRYGKPVQARIRFYPVRWYSLAVDGTAVVDKTTNSNGYYKFSASPFKPTLPSVQNPWDLTYCSFLVGASYGGKTVYSWLPLATVGASYFKSKTTPYTHQIKF